MQLLCEKNCVILEPVQTAGNLGMPEKSEVNSMKNDGFRRYLYIGLTALLVIVLAVCFSFAVNRPDMIRNMVGVISKILMPILYGLAMAYLMNPAFKKIKCWLYDHTASIVKNDRVRHFWSAAIATFCSILILCVVVTGLISLMIPELIKSIGNIIETFPQTAMNLRSWLANLFADDPELRRQVLNVFYSVYNYIQNFFQTSIIPNLYSIATMLSSQIISFLVIFENMVIGLIIMAYLLNIKDRLLTQAKMIIYGLLPQKAANKVLEECRYANSMFSGFIIGKVIDSIIIGCICFVILSLLKMPFPLLISVVIGCTNIIPFFGPFIGAIPSAVLILLVSPTKCIYFIIFILILQIFDGYILGPRILGGSTGVSSFWVLFSILLFGGMFGIVGMIIAVPTFAVLYRLLKELVFYQLGRKGLSVNYDDYMDLNSIDGDEKTYHSKDNSGK